MRGGEHRQVHLCDAQLGQQHARLRRTHADEDADIVHEAALRRGGGAAGGGCGSGGRGGKLQPGDDAGIARDARRQGDRAGELAATRRQLGLEGTGCTLREIVGGDQHVDLAQAALDHVIGGLGAFGFRQQAELAGIGRRQLPVVGMVQCEHRHRQLRLAEHRGDFTAGQRTDHQPGAIADRLLVCLDRAVGGALTVVDAHQGARRVVASRVEVGCEEALADRRARRGVIAVVGQQQGHLGGYLVAFAHVRVGAGQQGADRLLQVRRRLRHGDAKLAQRFVHPWQHAVAALHRGGALLERLDADLVEQVEDLLAILGMVETAQLAVHLHAGARGAPAVAAGGHGAGTPFQQAQLQCGRRHHVRLRGESQRGGRIVPVERELGQQQVEAERLVPAQALALDAVQHRGGALELTLLAPGLGGEQAVTVGVAARLRGEGQPCLGGLVELALPGQRLGALRGGEFGRRARRVRRHAGGQRQ